MIGRRTRLFLAVATLLVGASGLLHEYVLSVLGNSLLGSRLEELFIIMAMMMFAMGVGSLAQQHLQNALVDAFLWLQLGLALVGGSAAMVVSVSYVHSESYAVVLYGLAMLIGILVGVQVPLLLRLNQGYVSELRHNLGLLFSLDYAGALAGALLFVFVLLTTVSLQRIGFSLGLASVAVVVLGLVVFRERVARPRALTYAAGFVALLLGLGVQHADRWAVALEQTYFQHPIVFRETSQYQHIVLTRRDDRLRLYLNRHLQFDSRDEVIYHELLVHPAMSLSAARRRVLILGGGDGLALREVLKYAEVEEATVIDIDPAVVRMAATEPHLVRQNRRAFADPRVRLAPPGMSGARGARVTVALANQRRLGYRDRQLHPVAEVEAVALDADTFLQQTSGSYDVAILDFTDPREVETAKLFSREFYLALRERLAPGATVAVQSSSPFFAPELFLCVGATLRAAGFAVAPYQHNVPSFNAWGFHLATTGEGTDAELLGRLRAPPPLAVETTFLTPEVIAATTYFGKNWLAVATPIEVSTKMNPVILRYAVAGWRNY